MLKVDAEPGEVGLDAGRLRRLDDALRPYVDDGRLPGWTAVVTRRGRVVHLSHYGLSDLDSGRPVADDTIWRIYSMTKPITSVAAMMLYEQGRFELTDPVSRFIPEFADARVYVAGSANAPGTRPATEPVRVWHLLTHTAGLTYGWHHANAVDEIYRGRGYEFNGPEGTDLAGACAAWAKFPLLFDPGTEWNYSVATDVLGRVVEVASGLPLDRYFAEQIFAPLGMTDSAFSVPGDDLHRLAGLYVKSRDGNLTRSIRMGEVVTKPVALFSGGGGLVSTAADYHRFTQMLVRGGELDGARLLSPRTVAYMTRNHLPGGVDLARFGRPISAESAFEGLGFGLGFSVLVDPAAAKVLSSAGEYAWSGLARTEFYIDPVEEITTMFFTQLLPGPDYPLRGHLRGIVRAAVVD
ncbi:MAG: beta-lactamase family protein [Pseudonocardiales bacterium]|nr:beta-lactamase family protein [Pseudonocardiales bacterium]